MNTVRKGAGPDRFAFTSGFDVHGPGIRLIVPIHLLPFLRAPKRRLGAAF